MSKMTMLQLFHYTSLENEKMIRREGMIRRTRISDRDSMFGEGVYLTELNPNEFEKDTIAQNNWGPKGYKKSLREGKADAHIQVEIPKNDQNICKADAGDRNIYVYKQDLDFGRFSSQSGRNYEWGMGKSLGVAAGIMLGAAVVGGGLAWLGSYLGQDRCDKCGESFGDRNTLERHKRTCMHY